MVGKRSPSSFSSSFKQKLAKECVNPSIRKKDAVSIEGFLEKHLSRNP